MTESYSQGTLAGAGTFRCRACGFAVALHERDALPSCPHCGSRTYDRSSLFGEHAAAEPWGGSSGALPDWLPEAREMLGPDAPHLALREDDGEISLFPLEEEWTRLGRSMAAGIQFDDPTVSRRHALLHTTPAGTRILDDRSLNGVFVNGEHVEAATLNDGDEIAIGRFHLYFLAPAVRPARRLFASARRG